MSSPQFDGAATSVQHVSQCTAVGEVAAADEGVSMFGQAARCRASSVKVTLTVEHEKR